MSRPFRRVLIASLAVAALALAGVGAVTVFEYGYRATGLIQEARKDQITDLTLFTYSPYVTSVLPSGLVLGNSDSVLERFFKHGPCDLKDGTTARFNGRGFRGPDFTGLPAKRANEVRIVVTGDSAAMSWNVGEACTLTERLQTRLSEALPGRQIRVLNLANAGWVSFQQLIAVTLHGPEIRPDLVIVLGGGGDFHQAMYNAVNRGVGVGHMENAFRYYRRHVEAPPSDFLGQFHILKLVEALRRPLPPTKQADYPDRAPKAEPGHLLTRLHWPLDLDAIRARADFDPFNRQVVDNFIRNQRLIARALAAEGVHLIVALQPLLYLKEKLARVEQTNLLDRYHAHINFVVQAYLRARDGLQALTDAERNVTFLDLSAPFGARDDWMFADNVHVTEAGYKMLAEELGRAVVAILTGPKSGK